MSSDSPLDEVWKVYEVTKDCLKVTDRVLHSDDERFLRTTNFVGSTEAEAEKWIKNSHDETDSYVLVLLWVQFERCIVNFIQTKVGKLLEEEPKALAKKLHDKIGHEVEYWKKDDILDLLKGTIDSRQLGMAKNIKKYRDWVVHRNPKRLPPSKTDPKTAYRTLSEILDAVSANRETDT